MFCWIPAVFLSHFFLAQPWHCVALEYIYNRRQKAAKLRKKKKRYSDIRVDYDHCKLLSKTCRLLPRLTNTVHHWVIYTTSGGKLVKWWNYQVNKKWNVPFKPRGAFMTLIHISKNACLLPLSDKTSESKSDYWKSSPGRCWHGN